MFIFKFPNQILPKSAIYTRALILFGLIIFNLSANSLKAENVHPNFAKKIETSVKNNSVVHIKLIDTNRGTYFNASTNNPSRTPYERKCRKKLNNSEQLLVSAPFTYMAIYYWPTPENKVFCPFSLIHHISSTIALRGPPTYSSL